MTAVTISDADVGSAIGPPDGLLTTVRMAQPPSVYEVPEWDEGRMCWKTGCFVLRGSDDARDAVSVSPQTNGGPFTMGGNLLVSGNIAYSGNLTVVCVPTGSQWSVETGGGVTVAARPHDERPHDHRQRHRRR